MKGQISVQVEIVVKDGISIHIILPKYFLKVSFILQIMMHI